MKTSNNIIKFIILQQLFFCPGFCAQQKDPFQKDAVDRALDRGIAYLVSKQDKKQGWISDNRRNLTAMTSLSIMAFASMGKRAGDKTPEGRALRRALDYVLMDKRQDKEGYFGQADGSRMYGHGITTLMLGEMSGMGADDRQDSLIKKRLKAAVGLIIRSQQYGNKDKRFKGGWRYSPTSRDADLSVTVWQVMALRSAKNAGMSVPRDVIERASDYIKRSHKSRRDRNGRPVDFASPFAYQPAGRTSYSTCSAGVLALQVCGFYDDPTVKSASDWLMAHWPKGKTKETWFFYGTYYYAQGMYQRGGLYASTALDNVRRVLLEMQDRRQGFWMGGGQERDAGRVYSTCMAILSLSVKYHYLPIYQR